VPAPDRLPVGCWQLIQSGSEPPGWFVQLADLDRFVKKAIPAAAE
jgi:hypothetical protein